MQLRAHVYLLGIVISFFSNVDLVWSQNEQSNPTQEQLDSVVMLLKAFERSGEKEYKEIEPVFDGLKRIEPQASLDYFAWIDEKISSGQIKVLNNIYWALALSRIGKTKESKSKRFQALEFARNTENDPHYNMLANRYLVTQYMTDIKPDSARYYLKKCENLVLENPEILSESLWDLYMLKSSVYELIGDLDQSGYWMERAFEEVEKIPNHPQRGYLLFVLTTFFRDQYDPVRHARYGELLMERINKKKLETPDFHMPVRSIFLKYESPEDIQHLTEVIHASDSLNHLNAYAATVVVLSNIYLEEGLGKEAIPYLEELVQRLDEADYAFNYNREKTLLHQAYNQAGQYENAYNSLLILKQLEDSLRKEEVLNTVAELEVQYETEKNENELRLAILEVKKANQERFFFLLLSIAGLIIAGLVGFFLLKNRDKNRLLTKQKRQLEENVEEINLLLREIHHRVKNNLQVITSLLNIQQRSISDQTALAAIQESKNRIESMGLIHRSFYQNKHLGEINTREYIQNLVDQIFSSYNIDKNKVDLQTKVEDVFLDMDTLVPIGLIINEMVSNTLKHAFEEQEKGKLSISLEKIKDKIRLIISDNGKGIKDLMTLENSDSFGYNMIKAFIRKLNGEMNLKESAGTTFQIEFAP